MRQIAVDGSTAYDGYVKTIEANCINISIKVM